MAIEADFVPCCCRKTFVFTIFKKELYKMYYPIMYYSTKKKSDRNRQYLIGMYELELKIYAFLNMFFSENFSIYNFQERTSPTAPPHHVLIGEKKIS